MRKLSENGVALYKQDLQDPQPSDILPVNSIPPFKCNIQKLGFCTLESCTCSYQLVNVQCWVDLPTTLKFQQHILTLFAGSVCSDPVPFENASPSLSTILPTASQHFKGSSGSPKSKPSVSSVKSQDSKETVFKSRPGKNLNVTKSMSSINGTEDLGSHLARLARGKTSSLSSCLARFMV